MRVISILLLSIFIFCSPSPEGFVSSAERVAKAYEYFELCYGYEAPGMAIAIPTHDNVHCNSYVRHSLQASGYLGVNGRFHTDGKKQLVETDMTGYEVIKFKQGTPEVQNVKADTWYGEEGEYPTFEFLVENGVLEKGDIIVQYDNPNNINPETGKKQTRKEGGGTQSHVEIYAGNGKIYSVGAADWQHKVVNGKKVLRADRILSAENDIRNRHNNPHISFIVRLKD